MNRLFFGLCAGAIGCALALQFPAVAIAKSKETVLHAFGSGSDGNAPQASLIYLKHKLYGTTYAGGADGLGTVFSVDRTTGVESVVYSFQGGTNGELPEAGLLDVKGTLYGTTEWGGANGEGTVFAINPTTGAETVLYSFCSQANCTDGQGPTASLIDVNGKLYGTTYYGGPNDHGTVFSFNLKTGAETVLHTFGGGTDGAGPYGGLIDVNGTLYGTTTRGGGNDCDGTGAGCGTVFALVPTTGTETVLHAFGSGSNDGANPYDSVLELNGTLYGTTMAGGDVSVGTVFSVDPTTGAETVLHSFGSGSNDGISPAANLINVNGKLYGTTYHGGNDYGTVFSFNLKTGAEKVVYSFCSQQNCADGSQPYAGLIDVKGKLYGTTGLGGANDGGTVFAIKKP